MSQFFGSILRGIYDMVGNYGMSIVVFTIVTKVILLPLTIKQTKSSKVTVLMQPKMQEIQRKYAKDPQKQNEELSKLYQKYNYNPLSGCLPLLIQLPIIFGLFAVMREPTKYVFTPEEFALVDQSFLWIENLAQSASEVVKANGVSIVSACALILPLVNVLAMLASQKQTKAQTGDMQQAGGMDVMMKMMPFLIGFSAYSFAQGLSLYWALSTVISIILTVLIGKFVNVEVVVDEPTPQKKKQELNESGRKYSNPGKKKGDR